LALSKSNSFISKAIKITTLHKTIIEDLKLNRSTSDIEALYELQKVKDTKKQIELYFSFIKNEISRNDIRAINSKKSIHKEKSFYSILTKPKYIKLEINTKQLSSEKKSELEEELEKIVKKYYK